MVNRYTVKRILDGEPVGDEQDVAGRAAALAAMRGEADVKAAQTPGLLDERSRAGRAGLLGGGG